MEDTGTVEQLERRARIDYPNLHTWETKGMSADACDALDEIDRLRAEVAFLRNRVPVEL